MRPRRHAMNLQCDLCPKGCVIGPGQSGDCRIRVNLDGKLCAVTYGYPSAVHVDPVEKKPFNHFLPASSIFSIATVGCNLHCKNCQNWDLSQRNPEEATASPLPPEDVARLAAQYGCRSVAYTYSDPIAYYEYTLDCCRKTREAGLKNALVTAGYINEAPWRELCRHVDAATIDLKALSDAFYREICGATLAPILNALVVAKALGVFVEVSNLVIPTLNDSDEMLQALCRWVKENMGPETPLHFLGFHPQYQMRHLPPTPASTLERARSIARAAGLSFVYVGNVLIPDASNTRCPACGRVVVERNSYQVLRNEVTDGRCPACRTEIHGLWK
jgi:pyruvate formate lyase activating enzyme